MISEDRPLGTQALKFTVGSHSVRHLEKSELLSIDGGGTGFFLEVDIVSLEVALGDFSFSPSSDAIPPSNAVPIIHSIKICLSFNSPNWLICLFWHRYQLRPYE